VLDCVIPCVHPNVARVVEENAAFDHHSVRVAVEEPQGGMQNIAEKVAE
jgi:hypothetical protein